MLACAGFRDDAGLAHALGKKDLAKAIVDLVRAGVVQFVALEIDLCAAQLFGQTDIDGGLIGGAALKASDFAAIARAIFGNANDRALKSYQRRVPAINALEPDIAKLSDADLAARTAAFSRAFSAARVV